MIELRLALLLVKIFLLRFCKIVLNICAGFPGAAA
jgi:hypothetical protein